MSRRAVWGFVLQMLLIDTLLALFHSMYARVLLPDLVVIVDYLMRTICLAFAIHRHIVYYIGTMQRTQ